MWSIIFLSIFSILPLYFSKPVDVIRFDILHKGSSIGEFSAYKTVEKDLTTFVNTTEVKAKVIGEVRVKLKTVATYKNNELEQSTVDITVNGSSYANNTTKRSGDKYLFYKDGKLKSTISGVIRYSASMMIFGEPTGVNAAYSEESGAFHTIASTMEVYEKKNSRGRKSIYHYENQALKSLDIDIGLTKIEMVLKD